MNDFDDGWRRRLPTETRNAASTPSASSVGWYADVYGESIVLGMINPSGDKWPVGKSRARRRVAHYTSQINSTNVNNFGVTSLTLGASQTTTARVPVETSMAQLAARNGYVMSITTAGTLIYGREATDHIRVGNGSTRGGFEFCFAFVPSDPATVAGARMFAGLTPTAVPTNVEPSTLTQCIGIAQLSSSSNLHIVYGGSAAQTPIDLGANFPANTLSADLYTLELFSSRLTTNVSYRVTRNGGTYVATGTLTGTAGTALPSTTLLSFMWWKTNNATALVAAMDVSFYFTDEDY